MGGVRKEQIIDVYETETQQSVYDWSSHSLREINLEPIPIALGDL